LNRIQYWYADARMADIAAPAHIPANIAVSIIYPVLIKEVFVAKNQQFINDKGRKEFAKPVLAMFCASVMAISGGGNCRLNKNLPER